MTLSFSSNIKFEKDFKKLSLLFTFIMIVHLRGSSVSRIFNC